LLKNVNKGGTVSMLDPMPIRDVTYLTGGYPAPFINRTSGILQIAQARLERCFGVAGIAPSGQTDPGSRIPGC
jgi:hypothetical protein